MICDHKWTAAPQPCGCQLRKCSECESLQKASICKHHGSQTTHIPERRYYAQQIGCITEEGIPLNRQYIREMQAALASMRVKLPVGRVLEIGMGSGRLIPWFLRHQYAYEGLDVSDWACDYVRECFDVMTHCERFMDWQCAFNSFDLIACFHSLEHMKDAEDCFIKISDLLKPGGGFLYCGPAGTDLCNPDHVWYWPEAALRNWLSGANLKTVSTCTALITPHEATLYAYSEK